MKHPRRKSVSQSCIDDTQATVSALIQKLAPVLRRMQRDGVGVAQGIIPPSLGEAPDIGFVLIADQRLLYAVLLLVATVADTKSVIFKDGLPEPVEV